MSEYPKTLVKGDMVRQVENVGQEIDLRHRGFRDAADGPVERGGFLPPVRMPDADEAEPDAGQAPDESGPAKRRRKPTEPSIDPTE